MNLQERYENYTQSAVKAFEAGKIEEGNKFRAKAEKAKAALDGVATVKALGGVGEGSLVAPTKAVPESPDVLSADQRARAAYTLRFGDPTAAIKGILVDLHGSDYENKYWEQRKAFGRYLRRGEKGIDRAETALLREIVLTPAAVKMALMQGQDDVSAIKATMVEAVGTLGGFAVPVDFQTNLISRIAAEAVLRPKATVDQTSRDMVEVPISTGGDDQYASAVRVTWTDETSTAGTADTNMTFGLESIPVNTVMAETGLSRNMLEDAAFNVEQYLVRQFAEAAAIDEDNKFLVGTGAGTPQGILPGGTNALGLTERNSGAAATLTWDGILSMVYAIPYQYRQNAVWIGERATFEAVSKIKSGDNYLWDPYQYAGGQNKPGVTLLGFPVLEQESMPSIAANAYPLVFGDPRGYNIFDRVGMTVERYLDSSTARKNMIMYVMRRRVGGQPVESWRFATQKVSA